MNSFSLNRAVLLKFEGFSAELYTKVDKCL